MSFQTKTNRNAAKRIYNLNSFNNPAILDILKSQDTKLSSQSMPSYNLILKNDFSEDKNSLLSITGKQVICPNTYQRSNNKTTMRNNTEFVKSIKEIKLILQEPSKNLSPLTQNQNELLNSIQNNEFSLNQNVINSEKIFPVDISVQKYYEDVIINEPALYCKVISAYKNLQKTIYSKEKIHQFAKKRFSTNKFSESDKTENLPSLKQKLTRVTHKTSDSDGKNDQQKKKILYFNIYREFQLMLNLSNQCIIIPEQEGQYKAFIGKGNNGLLIKSILKSRPWWCIRTSNDIDNCNLIWTEWRKLKFLKTLPNSKFEKKIINHQSFEGQNFPSKVKNKKIESICKVLPEKRLSNFFSAFELKSDEQLTKFSKKISDSGFSLLAQKFFQNVEQKIVSKGNKIANHIPGCFQLHSKKLLFANLKKYYEKKKMNVFDYLPETYVISKGLNDPQYDKFLEGWEAHEKIKDKKNSRNIWICKPGENSNRGNGIVVTGTLNQIKNFIGNHSSVNGMCSALIQKYMQNPFLYNKRKFDIRCYILITTVNGMVKGYWYQDGYIRTTSKEYNLKNIENKFIHLTNDAVQKKGETYGKFQNFNKISFQDFQKYLEQSKSHIILDYQGINANFKTSLQKMKQMATDLIQSVGRKLNPDRKQFSFQLFGLDFMLDDKLDSFIIQANSNPCIQVQGNVLGRIIPSMLQNMMRVAIDPIFPPPYSENPKYTKYSPGNVVDQNKFTLVYDSLNNQPKQQDATYSKEQQEEERLIEAQIQRENQQEV